MKPNGIEIRSLVRTTAVTGVEMEALVAASVAALTVYDMCKALDKGIEIREVRLERKSGGKSGDYSAKRNRGNRYGENGGGYHQRFRGTRPARPIVSGPATVAVLRQHGFDVTQERAVVDDQDEIERTLIQLSEQVQLIVTTGGTGIAERDVTPEATRAVCSKLIDGIPEKMRAVGIQSTKLRDSQPRGVRSSRPFA